MEERITNGTRLSDCRILLWQACSLCVIAIRCGCAGPSSGKKSQPIDLVIATTGDGGWSISGNGVPPALCRYTSTHDTSINRATLRSLKRQLGGSRTKFISALAVGDGGVGYIAYDVDVELRLTFCVEAGKEVRINSVPQVDPLVLKPGVHGFRLVSLDEYVKVEHVEE